MGENYWNHIIVVINNVHIMYGVHVHSTKAHSAIYFLHVTVYNHIKPLKNGKRSSQG